MSEPRPLAILGGTFDPIHHGHLRAAWEAAEALHAEVRLVPARTPPHRPPPVADAAGRVALLRAALAGQDRLTLDTRELDRDGPSYTVDTLASLRADVGPDRPLVLLVGADAFAGLASWHLWRDLFTFAHVGVLTRPGAAHEPAGELAGFVEGRRADRVHGPAGSVVDIAITPLDIAATAIREAFAAGGEPRFLLPTACFDDEALLAPYRALGR
ncbi:nicotinate-nucleotide adenylyltransferase [Luteibacter sp. UNC138MFCol5.1]|uniref:nicotinate-nucleotide adenylyltransferase n=1 Tax=Luteibacter sp. UNC138MFCol5.1 TaxID=1502774 RepID=UPI0008B37EB0|nr:nicotinate-nucleotide adenylyltransferase [Luteibacter sp. UNC138MFCol5.1]SEO85962.1 nicotinate-nucleotide adenylyltransferase [Luteibacter sp. UNC138MFCol5.1]